MKILIFLFVISLLVLTSCKEVPEELKCTIDEECVASTCCHPDSCVNEDSKPECEGRVCSMNCEPGTMDCGQGKCVCENNKCAAIIG